MPRSSLTHYFGLGPTVRPLNVVALASSALLSISFLVFLNSVQPFFLTSVLHPPVPRDRLGQVTGTLILADELLSLLLVFAWGVVADRVTVRWVAVAGHIIAGGGLGLYTLSKRVYPDVLLSRLVFAVSAAPEKEGSMQADALLSQTGASALVMVLGAALAGMTSIPKDSPVEESSETTALLPAAAPNPAHSARFAGLLGFSSGIGALLAGECSFPVVNRRR